MSVIRTAESPICGVRPHLDPTRDPKSKMFGTHRKHLVSRAPQVYCDMTGGRWNEILRRGADSEDNAIDGAAQLSFTGSPGSVDFVGLHGDLDQEFFVGEYASWRFGRCQETPPICIQRIEGARSHARQTLTSDICIALSTSCGSSDCMKLVGHMSQAVRCNERGKQSGIANFDRYELTILRRTALRDPPHCYRHRGVGPLRSALRRPN